MKQTIIHYQEAEGFIFFLGYENIANQTEIDKELGPTKRAKYYSGRSYFNLATIGDATTVRCYNSHEFGDKHYVDYSVGQRYTIAAWNLFIKFLKQAGARYTKIHHEPDVPIKVKTIRI